MAEPGEITTNMRLMYQAGRVDIPAEASHIANITHHLYGGIDSLNVQSALAGDPAIMRDMLTVTGDLYEVLQLAVVSLNNCADAVIATADDFRNTDDQAARDYASMEASLKTGAPPEATPPPAINNPEAPGATTTVTNEDRHGNPIFTEETVESTPDPVKPEEDGKVREDQEDRSEFEHEREKRRGS